MSGHNHHHEQYNSANAGTSALTDPGTGTLDLQGKSGAFVDSVGEVTLTLPEAVIGVTVFVYSSTGTTTLVDGGGTIISVTADTTAACFCTGSDDWNAVLLDDAE